MEGLMALVEKYVGAEGQRSGFCKQCHGKDDKSWYHHDPMRALYVRFTGKFERIGWVFEKCGHVEIDNEKYRSRHEEIERVKNEKHTKRWNERIGNSGEDENVRTEYPPIEIPPELGSSWR
jgi:hypothetical protein